MRQIQASDITRIITSLCVRSNYNLPDDVRETIEKSRCYETWPVATDILDQIITNYHLAEKSMSPICQDTGMTCVFMEIGQEVHIIGGNLINAVDEGVKQGYEKGYLRKSVVDDPLIRNNTGDNTPAMLYTDIVPGDKIKITVAPKGFGSENMSQIKMLLPSDGRNGVIDFVLSAVQTAGPNPCPPIVVGIGLGGTFDKAALLAKKALLRPMDLKNSNTYYAELENELLHKINMLGIGPQGFGGRTTALHVAIETLPTHIAGLPCAVNINCHVARHATKVL